MVVVGKYSFEEIKDRLERSEKLSPNLVIKGECYKESMYQDKMGSFDLLWLGPLATIRVHSHIEDRELYFDWYDNNMEFCEMGQSHGLKNTSKDEWALVLSIKRND